MNFFFFFPQHVYILKILELRKEFDQSIGHCVLFQVELPLIWQIVSQNSPVFREIEHGWMHLAGPGYSELITHSPGSDLVSPLPGGSDQIRSVTKSCPTLCYPMNRSMPGLPVHHQLPELTETHVHQVSDAIQPSHPLLSPSPPAPNPSQHQSLFQWVNSSHEVAKVVRC